MADHGWVINWLCVCLMIFSWYWSEYIIFGLAGLLCQHTHAARSKMPCSGWGILRSMLKAFDGRLVHQRPSCCSACYTWMYGCRRLQEYGSPVWPAEACQCQVAVCRIAIRLIYKSHTPRWQPTLAGCLRQIACKACHQTGLFAPPTYHIWQSGPLRPVQYS